MKAYNPPYHWSQMDTKKASIHWKVLYMEDHNGNF